MRIGVVTDVHIGAKNDSVQFANYQLKFFEDEFFVKLKTNKIDTVICCGDLFDRRKFTNHVVLDMWIKRFFDYMQANDITFHLVLGNHDLALRNSLSINAPKLFLSHYKNVIIYDVPTDVCFDGTDIALLPWICSENYDTAMSFIQQTKSQILFGHLELANFQMHKGQVHNEGMDAKLFSQFETVYSGHYHHRNTVGNITYLGCPMEFTWIDYGDSKGYHIFDTKKREVEFFKNPYTLFNKIVYDDKDEPDTYWKNIEVASLEQTFVKIMVVNKTDPYQFDRFLDRCFNANFADLKIIEDLSELDSDSVDDDDISFEDTMTISDSYIDAIDVTGDKTKLKTLMKSLYVEALEVSE